MAKKKYYQRPDGLYETSRTINGKRVVFRGRTCAEVDRKILEHDVTKKKGRKFPVIATEWLASRGNDLAWGTFKGYRKIVNDLCAVFPMHIGEITPLDLRRAVVNVERMGYSKGYVERFLSVAKQICSYAVLSGDIAINIAREVKMSRNLPAGKRPALTEEQERKVESCRTGRWWLLGLMLLYTGCRRGELAALEWQDIDRVNKTITINKKLNWSESSTHPKVDHFLKNKSTGRTIPLFDILADALPRNRIGRIFTFKNGEYFSIDHWTVMWREYCRDAGLVDDDGNPVVTAHQFRHSYATICYEAGIDSRAAAAFLGDTEKVTQAVYTELRERHHFSAAEQVNAYLTMRRELPANEA